LARPGRSNSAWRSLFIPDPFLPGRIRLSDLAGLVFGYGLASLLVKAFLPAKLLDEGWLFLVLTGLIYLWLGLAMSGPVILTFDRWRRNAGPASEHHKSPVRHTRAELCWLLIGGYWLMLAACLISVRIPGTTAPLFFFVPGLAVLMLGLASVMRSAPRVTSARAWTHRAAVVLLATWPLVWGFTIVLSSRL
jgi:hypothetical protein